MYGRWGRNMTSESSTCMATRPLPVRHSPASARMMLVLPDPEGPMIKRDWPEAT